MQGTPWHCRRPGPIAVQPLLAPGCRHIRRGMLCLLCHSVGALSRSALQRRLRDCWLLLPLLLGRPALPPPPLPRRRDSACSRRRRSPCITAPSPPRSGDLGASKGAGEPALAAGAGTGVGWAAAAGLGAAPALSLGGRRLGGCCLLGRGSRRRLGRQDREGLGGGCSGGGSDRLGGGRGRGTGGGLSRQGGLCGLG
jgi:hypothetical protein